MRISDCSSDVCSSDLQRTAPSLSIATGGGAPTSIVFVAIRGQGQNEPTTATDPAVGIYVDGVYIARPTGSNLRSEEHTSELQSLMRISYAVFCLKKKKTNIVTDTLQHHHTINANHYTT